MKITLFKTILLLLVLSSMEKDVLNVYAQKRRSRKLEDTEEVGVEKTEEPPSPPPVEEADDEDDMNEEDGMTEE